MEEKLFSGSDPLAKELQSFLVRLHYEPECISHQVSHYLEHLTHLLEVADEEALLHYFGILGHEQYSLDDIADDNHLSPEQMMEHIDTSLHKLAITPEWQMLKQFIKQ